MDVGGISRWIDLDGPVHYRDFGGPPDGPVLVCVHGLGGSALNWAALAPLLTDEFQVLAIDLAGHGRTRPAGRSTDVSANTDLVEEFLRAVVDGPALIAGNSMGGMLGLHLAAQAPDVVGGLVLVDPAVPFVVARPDPVVAAAFASYAIPGVGPWAARTRMKAMSPERATRFTLSLCTVDIERIPGQVFDAHVQEARERRRQETATADFLMAARSVVRTSAARKRYRRTIEAVTQPVLLIHGDRDRLVPLAAAEAAAEDNRHWTFTVLSGVGHVPQLEVPEATSAAVRRWWYGPGTVARDTVARRLAVIHV